MSVRMVPVVLCLILSAACGFVDEGDDSPGSDSPGSADELSTHQHELQWCKSGGKDLRIISRRGWGAAPARGTRPKHSPYKLSIHHTVTANTADNAKATVRQVQSSHFARGFSDIGYHFLVDRKGRIYRGTPENRTGAHVSNQNTGNLGIALLGSYHLSTAPTAAQLRATSALVRRLARKYGIPINRHRIRGHQEQGQTACPGGQVMSRMSNIVGWAKSGRHSCGRSHYDAKFAVRIRGNVKNVLRDGPSKRVGDVFEGKNTRGVIYFHNKSNETLQNIRVGYRFDRRHLDALDYRIETRRKGRKSWHRNGNLIRDRRNPKRARVRPKGTFYLGNLRPGDRRRVVVKFRAGPYSLGEGKHARFKAWVKRVKGAYGPARYFGSKPRKNKFGKRLRGKFDVDVLARNEWHFETGDRRDREGWRVCRNGHTRGLKQRGGALRMLVTGRNSCVVSPGYARLNADAWDEMVVRVRTNQGPHPLAVLWKRRRDDRFGPDRRVIVEAIGDGQFHDLVIPVGEASTWEGVIDRLRIDPLEGEAPASEGGLRVFIDAIYFQNSETMKTSTSRASYLDADAVMSGTIDLDPSTFEDAEADIEIDDEAELSDPEEFNHFDATYLPADELDRDALDLDVPSGPVAANEPEASPPAASGGCTTRGSAGPASGAALLFALLALVLGTRGRRRFRWRIAMSALVVASGFGCADVDERSHHEAHHEAHEEPSEWETRQQGLVSCNKKRVDAYRSGARFRITTVTADGKPAEIHTAAVYHRMQRAAAKDGVQLRIVSGFRSMAEQRRLYECYQCGCCNNGNLAAYPGYSNHQSGHALDLNTSSPGVYSWLERNASRFGFSRTVPGEPWHWEWWGRKPKKGKCLGPEYRAKFKASLNGNANFFKEGKSKKVKDATEGSTFNAVIYFKNKSDRRIHNVRVGYALPRQFVDARSYKIEVKPKGKGWRNASRALYRQNRGRRAIGDKGGFFLGTFRKGMAKRVRIKVKARKTNLHRDGHLKFRAWVKTVKGVYGPARHFGSKPNKNKFGKRLRRARKFDVVSRDYWRFDSSGRGDREGWRRCNQHVDRLRKTSLNRRSSALVARVRGRRSCLRSPRWTRINANRYDQMVIRIKSFRGPHAMAVFWKRNRDDRFGPERRVAFQPMGDGQFEKIVINMSDHPDWNGMVKRLRIDPLEGPPDRSGQRHIIDKVYFQSSSDEAVTSPFDPYAVRTPIVTDHSEDADDD